MTAEENKKIVVLGFSFIKENKKLTKDINKLLEDKNLDVDLEQNADLLEFLKHGVVLAPAVIVDGKLKSAGKVPSVEELEEWINILKDTINYQKELSLKEDQNVKKEEDPIDVIEDM